MALRLNKPHEAQLEVIRSSARFNVVACGRRWGKTALAAEYLVPRCLSTRQLPGEPIRPARDVGWFAPSYKLLEEAWDRLTVRLSQIFGAIDANKAERRIIVKGRRVDFWTLSGQKQGESVAGRGRKYGLAVIDEAAHARYLEDDWHRAIRPTLTDYRGEAWLVSTPRGRNGFYRLWMRGQQEREGWASFQQPTCNNPFLPSDEIEAAKDDLPSDAYQQEYLAEFLADAANPFGVNAIGRCVTQLEHAPVEFWGVDLAKSTDWTVVCGLDDNMNIVAFQRWQSDWRNTISRIEAMIGQTPALVDATGVGDPIVEELQARCPRVEGYKFPMQSKQALMEGLAVAIQRRELCFDLSMTDPLKDELEAFQYEYRPSGVKYTAPDGVHDDCVDATALAVMCYRRNIGQRVRIDAGYDWQDRQEKNWWSENVDNPDIWADA